MRAKAADLFLIYVEGESMESTLRPGDMILIDRRDQTQEKDGIYVLRLDGTLLVKRLQKLPGGIIEVTSDNPAYRSYSLKWKGWIWPLSVVWCGLRGRCDFRAFFFPFIPQFLLFSAFFRYFCAKCAFRFFRLNSLLSRFFPLFFASSHLCQITSPLTRGYKFKKTDQIMCKTISSPPLENRSSPPIVLSEKSILFLSQRARDFC